MHLIVLLMAAFFLYSIEGFARSGFSFSEGQHTALIHFQTYHNLIILPVRLNNDVDVNLILDTGSFSIVLYGDRFKDLNDNPSVKNISFRGRGNEGMVNASLLVMGAVDFGAIHGEGLGVVVVSSRKMVPECYKIDGLIGYDLFSYFIVEINYREKTLRLFDKLGPDYTRDFRSIPLEIDNGKPYVVSKLGLKNTETKATRLLIDTGSSLFLTLFSNSRKEYSVGRNDSIRCIGLSGYSYGIPLSVGNLSLGPVSIVRPAAHFVLIRKLPDELAESASLGGGFLRKYIVIFDHASAMLYLKKN